MNQNKVYVGNLSYQTSPESLTTAFSAYGEVSEVKIIKDRDTGRSKGFAFVTFNTNDAAQASLKLDGTTLDNRLIKVSLAKDKEERTDRRSGGFGGQDNRSGGGRRW